jgi:hypothetical protein
MNLDLLDPKLIVLVAAVVVIAVALVWFYVRKRRRTTANLRETFGPEYDRAVLAHGSERKAESKLADREKRVELLKIRDLDSMEHERFSKRWASVQSGFVDSPKGAVTEGRWPGHKMTKNRCAPFIHSFIVDEWEITKLDSPFPGSGQVATQAAKNAALIGHRTLCDDGE